MQRRTVLAGAAIALAGCNGGDSEPDDSQGGARRVGPTPDESELPDVGDDWLSGRDPSKTAYYSPWEEVKVRVPSIPYWNLTTAGSVATTVPPSATCWPTEASGSGPTASFPE